MEMVTKAEKEQIEARLAALIANRPVIAQRIAEARALGDLKENGDYHAAREQQGIEESEIRRYQERLAGLSVIDEKMQVKGVVFLGATVKIEEVGSGEPELIKLVGEGTGALGEVVEVTATSPMGEAMMKAQVGETVSVRTPRGTKKFKILEIL
jgi:transcription elongation factor GreA